ncbi:MAG: hypothetical protein A2391_00655 [Candidatus Brennerbacteria bacterium RIFOXYB1_FULL_41_13]|nr:MAG: hypothetical protein A2391_00655 [Candidatus Brennerbacteria bacterium RIFOXYB1_FULL_41_13]
MQKQKLVFFEAVFLLVGTIIGAGYLTLPFSFFKAGIFANLFWLLFLGFFITLLHLFYAEIVLATKEHHRFPGYVGLYLGKFAKSLATVSFVAGVFGSLLIYLLLGSHFSKLLLGSFLNGFNIDERLITFIFGFVVSLLVMLKINLSAKINFGITVVTLSLFLLVSGFASMKINAANFFIVPNESFFFPFGLILFALVGSFIIPEITKLLEVEKQKKSLIKPVIITGTVIPVAIYFFFATSIFGASGQHTTKEAISGLVNFLPPPLVFGGMLLAFLEIITSYIAFGINTVETLRKDFGFSKFLAKLATVLLPLGFFILGVKDFLGVMGFMGSILTTIDSILLALVYLSLKSNLPGYKNQVISAPKPVVFALILVLVLGGSLSFYYGF